MTPFGVYTGAEHALEGSRRPYDLAGFNVTGIDIMHIAVLVAEDLHANLACHAALAHQVGRGVSQVMEANGLEPSGPARRSEVAPHV